MTQIVSDTPGPPPLSKHTVSLLHLPTRTQKRGGPWKLSLTAEEFLQSEGQWVPLGGPRKGPSASQRPLLIRPLLSYTTPPWQLPAVVQLQHTHLPGLCSPHTNVPPSVHTVSSLVRGLFASTCRHSRGPVHPAPQSSRIIADSVPFRFCMPYSIHNIQFGEEHILAASLLTSKFAHFSISGILEHFSSEQPASPSAPRRLLAIRQLRSSPLLGSTPKASEHRRIARYDSERLGADWQPSSWTLPLREASLQWATTLTPWYHFAKVLLNIMLKMSFTDDSILSFT